MYTAGRGSNDDLRVWPANLPSGAKWLPYGAEPARLSPPLLAPQVPESIDEPPRRLRIPYWRLLVVASITAGFVGILGGTAVGLILGIH
jgi:hypothetical protein